MNLPRSIRWRLQLWYGVLLLTLLAGFGFMALQFERARLIRRVDEGMQMRLSVLLEALRTSRVRPPNVVALEPEKAALFGVSSGFYYAVWLKEERLIMASENVPQNLRMPALDESLVRMRGSYRETFLFAAPVDCVLVGRSMDFEHGELRTFAVRLVMAGVVVLAVGLIGGWWVATSFIQPLDEIARAASGISEGDLSRRIPTAGMTIELGKISEILNLTFGKLEASFQQQARFSADAAHELRTPIAVILTQVQGSLSRDRSCEELRTTLETVRRAILRMRRLVESLLDLSRLDAGQALMRTARCDLADIVQECVELIQPLAFEKNIQIAIQTREAPFSGDSTRVAQVVTNLLSNALDYNVPGGEVRVSVETVAQFVELSVWNTGPGIGPEDLPHIFDRFRRAEKSRSQGDAHSGLGLAIAKAIVSAHGGSIHASSDPGRAALFVVRFPA